VTQQRDYAKRNRDAWERLSDEYQELHGELLDMHGGRAWGVWRVPEDELAVLGDVKGRDILELGCGAARWSAALARLGARPVGLDASSRQLDHARHQMAASGLSFALVEASAEDVPLPSESFDVVLSDHGGFSVADPNLVMRECARLLRHDGLLAFTKVTPIFDVAYDVQADAVDERLCNSYFDLNRIERAGRVEFQLTYGGWIRLFRDNGFEIEDLIELRPPEHARTTFDLVPLSWARRWPAEQIWKVRRRR
jgi:SAM-dependent methyltransferase